MSSTLSGSGKSEKQPSKFKGIDINTIYKGSSSSPPKTAPTSRQHGLQVLGKVQNIRRMPPPANLPSLKSQSGGNDPNVNLVPAGNSSGGWSGTKEEKTAKPSKIAAPATTTPPSATTAVQKSSQQQQAGGPLPHHQLEGSSHTHHHHQHQQQGEGGILWSDITSGGRKNYLDRKSFSLQEDFPELCAGGEEKSSGHCSREDASREQPYGPGPSLRPQNVASWRDGGGKGSAQQPPESPQSRSPSPQRPSSEDGQCAGPPYQQVPLNGVRPPMMRGHPPMPFMGPPMPMMPPMTGGPPYPPRPPHMMMMPPPYAFRHGFHPPYPPNFIPPGMTRPPYMGHEFGMRPRMPPSPSNDPLSPTSSSFFSGGCYQKPDGSESKDRAPPLRSSVVKERDLEQFDKLEITDGSGWARSSVNVDYSEKLVFSDDEDVAAATTESVGMKNKLPPHHPSENGQQQMYKWGCSPLDSRGWSEEEKGKRSSKQDDPMHSSTSSTSFRNDNKQYLERGGPDQRPNSVGMLPGDMTDHYPGHYPPGPYMRHPTPYDRQWPGAPPMAYDRRCFPPNAPYGPVGAALLPAASPDVDADDDDKWHERQMQHSQEMASAIERARQRREEEERKLMEEQKTASMLKLKQLDEKINAKKAAEKEKGQSEDGGTDDKDGLRRQLSSDSKSSLTMSNKPSMAASATSLSSSGGNKFLKSHSEQSVDNNQNSPEIGERPESSPCLQSKNQGPPYHRDLPPRMPPPHPSFGYWGPPYDPRWGPISLHPPAYAMDQVRLRMKGPQEHSGSRKVTSPTTPVFNKHHHVTMMAKERGLDDLHQGVQIPKHPLPAPPQPHNYYQYHLPNYQPGSDSFDGMRYSGDYKDYGQKGSQPDRTKDKSRSYVRGHSGSEDAGSHRHEDGSETDLFGVDYGHYPAPHKVSRTSPSEQPPQRRTILPRNKSESERSEDRMVTSISSRERVCSTSSGVSSKSHPDDVPCQRDSESKDSADHHKALSSMSESHKESLKVMDRKHEDDDMEGHYNNNKLKINSKQQQDYRSQHAAKQQPPSWQQPKIGERRDEKSSETVYKPNVSSARQFQSPVESMDVDEEIEDMRHEPTHQFNKRNQQQPNDSTASDHQSKHPSGFDEVNQKKEFSGNKNREVAVDRSDCHHDRHDRDDKKNDYNRGKNSDNQRTQERKQKPRERQIYQQQQWHRSACPPPISMDQAEQNRPSTSSYTSLKKQQQPTSSGSAAAAAPRQNNEVSNKKASELQKQKLSSSNLDRKSLSKESLKSDKKGDSEENARRSDKGASLMTTSAREGDDTGGRREGKRQKYAERELYHHEKDDYSSSWKNDDGYDHEKDGKDYYAKKDGRDYVPSGRGNRSGKNVDKAVDVHGSREGKSSRNYRDANEDEDGRSKYESKEKNYYCAKDKDGGYYPKDDNRGNTNKRNVNSRGGNKIQEQGRDTAAGEKGKDKEMESDIKVTGAKGGAVKEDSVKPHDSEKSNPAPKKVDSGSVDSYNKHGGSGTGRGGGGRPSRSYRGGKVRDYHENGDYQADESKYRSLGSREFVRGGSKSYGGRGRDHHRGRDYIDEDDEEWEDERMMTGERGGRYPMRLGGGRRNLGRRPKMAGGSDYDGTQHKRQQNEGKRSLPVRDVQSSEDPTSQRKESTGSSRQVASSGEGIPSLMSKTITPPAMAKIQLLSDSKSDKQTSSSSNDTKQAGGKETKSSNRSADNEQDKMKEDNKGYQIHHPGNQSRQPSALASGHRQQSHYHRSSHHYFLPGNNYDRRPRSSRGPGSGHKISSGERTKAGAGGATVGLTSSPGYNNSGISSGLSGKDKKQCSSEMHNEEWETASEGSEVMAGSSSSQRVHNNNDSAPHQNVRQQSYKDGPGEATTTKKGFGGQRQSDRNSRRSGGGGGGYRNSSGKTFQGDESSNHGAKTFSGADTNSTRQLSSAEKSALASGTAKGSVNNSINNANKMVEGSSGDGNGGSCGSSGSGSSAVVVDSSFPSTAGDGAGSKDAHVYLLHSVRYLEPVAVGKCIERAKRRFIMRIIDPWSS